MWDPPPPPPLENLNPVLKVVRLRVVDISVWCEVWRFHLGWHVADGWACDGVALSPYFWEESTLSCMLYFQNRFPTRLALIWRLAHFILIRCLVDLNPHRFYKVCKVQALECNCQEMWLEDFHVFCCKSYEAHVKKLSEKKHVFVDTMHVQHVIDESLKWPRNCVWCQKSCI